MKLWSGFRTLTHHAERGTGAVANGAYEKISSWRRRLRQTSRSAKVKLAREERAVRDQSKRAAIATAAYAQKHPWRVTGLVVGVTGALGLLSWRRSIRSRT